MLKKDQFGIIQNLQMLFSKPVSWLGLFFAISYSKPSRNGRGKKGQNFLKTGISRTFKSPFWISKFVWEVSEFGWYICRQEEENKLGQRHIETEKIKAILEARALKIKDIPSDGDCLFAGVIHQLENNMKVSELRTSSWHIFTNSLTTNIGCRILFVYFWLRSNYWKKANVEHT